MTPHMRRITVAGDALAKFPTGAEGGYVKLCLSDAAGANLEQLPADATGYAVIEILSDADKQTIAAPAGVDVRWIVNSDTDTPNQPLVEEVTALDWLPGTPYPWFAGEFDAMRRIRRFFRDEKDIDRRSMYVSCYWKLGDSDEGMKRAKRLDAERDAA